MRMKKVLSLVLAGILLVAFSNATLAAKFYRWKDADGVTHYTVEPPPDGIQAEEVRTFNTSSSDQPDALRRLEQQRESAAESREQREKKERAKENPDEEAKDRCQGHRDNLKVLQNEAVVRSKDPETGEFRTLSDEEKSQALAETQEALKRCESQQAAEQQ